MRIIRNEDFYSLSVSGYISNVELRALNVLYTPFIGVVSSMLYLTLLRTRNYKNGELVNHEFLATQLQISNDQMLTAFRRLEAVSLVTTYKKVHEHFNEYVYVLSAPKNPALFSDDDVLMFLLENVVGERHAQALLQLFALDKSDVDALDVSADFSSVYGDTIIGAPAATTNNRVKLTNEIAQISTPFDKALFFNELTRSRQILPTALSDEEIMKIMRVATLFNLTERAIAEKVGDFYEPTERKGRRINVNALTEALSELANYPEMIRPLKRRRLKTLSGESEMAKLINQMETMAAFDFLYMLNNNTPVAQRDGEIINLLVVEMGLAPSATNALLYYALETYDNVLPKAAIEKLASSILRRGLVSAVDVYDALKTPIKYKRQTKKVETKPEKEAPAVTESAASILAAMRGEDEN